MVRRAIKLNKNNSLFLFGARGTGKSTLLKRHFDGPDTLWIDLLTDADEDRFGRSPDELSRVLAAKKYKQVVIDEIQKAPKLLDIVHHEIEKSKVRFILTGSSARKLKRGGANLLGGRAITYNLFPFTAHELKAQFDLSRVLAFGSLPKVYFANNSDETILLLKSYVKTYIREEILIEQVIRNVEPFNSFLEVAAQMNGELINKSKIAKDVGVNDKTIKSYYDILEDTLLGFTLKPFHRSVRRRQVDAAKFYYFDCGVKRAIENTLKLPLEQRTSEYGRAFEHFLILEAYRLNEYFQLDYKLSFLRTKDHAEIDLILERPGKKDLLIEIKSTNKVTDEDVRTLQRFANDWDRPCEAQVWSQDPLVKRIGKVFVLPWQEALSNLIS
jgi:uncharacterized protein